MKIDILFGRFDDYEDYPGADIEAAETPRAGKTRKKKKKKKTDVEAIADALRELRHEPSLVAIDGKPATLARLARSGADLFFNLVESYNGDDTMEMHFCAYLDLIGRRYTGAGPQGSYLAMDKMVAKTILRAHGLYSPYAAVSYKGRTDLAQDVQFPLIVKPAAEDASKGIDAGAVVKSVKELLERVAYVQEEFDSPALIEEYIEGREIYAAVLGNDPPEALPLVELDLSKLPDDMPRIAGYEVKFDTRTEAYKKTKSAPARDLDEAVTAEIHRAALIAFRALKLRDYARLDLRLGHNGRAYVIEANPNPWLDPTAEFAMAAKEGGRSFTQMIGTIVDAAMARKR